MPKRKTVGQQEADEGRPQRCMYVRCVVRYLEQVLMYCIDRIAGGAAGGFVTSGRRAWADTRQARAGLRRKLGAERASGEGDLSAVCRAWTAGSGGAVRRRGGRRSVGTGQSTEGNGKGARPEA